MRRPKPLVQFNSSYYHYPISVRSGKYLISQGLSEFEAKERDKWLTSLEHPSSLPLIQFVSNSLYDPNDSDLLRSLAFEHGIFAERFFHRALRKRVIPTLSRTQNPETHVSELMSIKWGTNAKIRNLSEAVFHLLDQLYDLIAIPLLEDKKFDSQLRDWFQEYAPLRACELCGRNFRIIDLPDWIYFGSNGFKSCCFKGTIVEAPRKAELHHLIPLFVRACGFVPGTDAGPINYSFTVRLRAGEWASAIGAFARMGGIAHVKTKFGSWFKGLAATGALPDGVMETSRGIRCLAKDGHVCHSLEEQQIDNWLSSHNIEHEREPKYPFHAEYNPSGSRRADWRVGDKLLEYFGLVGDEAYDKKTDEKIMLAEQLGIEVIPIYPSDLEHLEKSLGPLVEV